VKNLREAQFSGPASDAPTFQKIPEQIARQEQQRELRKLVLALLSGFGTDRGRIVTRSMLCLELRNGLSV